jgi:autotransporter-associated beta strand protein
MAKRTEQLMGTRTATATLVLVGLTALATGVKAATYTYDGIGNWTTSGDNWGGGAASVSWDAGAGRTNTAVFNTAGRPAVRIGALYANGIAFAKGATLAGGSITMVGTDCVIEARADAEIGGAVVVPHESSLRIRTADGVTLTLGDITLLGDSQVFVEGGGDCIVKGTISGGGNPLIAVRAGRLTLSGQNAHRGTTDVGNGSTLVLGRRDALGASRLNFSLVNGSATLEAASDLTGDNRVTNAIAIYNWWEGPSRLTVSGRHSIEFSAGLDGALLDRTIINSLPAGKELTLNGVAIAACGKESTMTFAGTGDTRIRGVISNGGGDVGSLILSSAGRTTLDGVSTYTGPTTIINGTVLVNGALYAGTRTNTTTVSHGGKVAGTGTIRGKTYLLEEGLKGYDARRLMALDNAAQGSDLGAAVARLYLNRDVEEANRIVMGADFEKLYWESKTIVIPLYAMFNADTGSRAKLLSRAATERLREVLWHWFPLEEVRKADKMSVRNYHFLPDRPWEFVGNQNHGFIYQTQTYFAADALKGVAQYADQFDPAKHLRLGAGVANYEERPDLAKITLAGFADMGAQMWRNRFLWLAKQGLWAEDMIYRSYSVRETYDLAYHAQDPIIRTRARMLLDLHWLIYALQTVDGQFGGAQNRFKPGYEAYQPDRALGWYYFGGQRGGQEQLAPLLGEYRPPEIAFQLLQQPEKRGCFAYRERLTQFSAEKGQPPHTYKYSYVTPEYVLGSYIAQDLTKGPGRYNERAFNGITFGKARAMLRLGPDASFQGYHFMQNGPILLCRWYGTELMDGGADNPWAKRYPNQQAAATIIGREGGGAPIKPAVIEGGWIFGEAGDAYFALRPAQGQCTVNTNQFTWAEAKMPVVIHAGGATEDGSFDAFKKKVLSNRLTYKDGVLAYEDAKWGKTEFCPDTAKPADQWRRINGKPVALPDKLFDSPCLTSDYDSGIIKAQFNGHKLMLDFNKNERIEE